MNSLYNQAILEFYEDKSNVGELKTKTHRTKIKNPICNDEIIVELEIENEKIRNARFSGTNCFVSTVAAAALMQNIQGMKIKDVLSLSKKDVDKMLGTKISQTRIKCELLPLEAVKKCLE